MVIDFHTHIFPKKIRENREDFFDGEPSFKLLYESPASKLVGADELVDTMDDQGVDISVVFGFPWTNEATYREHNDYIVEAVSRFPDHLIGFGCFDLNSPGAPAEAVRCLENGLSGIGELALYGAGIDDAARQRLSPIMETCGQRDVPLLIHTNEPVGHLYPGKSPIQLREIYDLARAFPDNKIVLAHWGGGLFFYELLKKEVKTILKNVYFDTAASPFLYDRSVYSTAAAIAGPGRILFGSDYPLLIPSRYFREMKDSGLSGEDRAMICGLSAAALLNIAP